MKKLLSMIGAMTLIGTASTNVIACCGGETPKPEPSPSPQADFSEITETTGAVRTLLTTSDGTVYAGTTTATGNSVAGKLFKK